MNNSNAKGDGAWGLLSVSRVIVFSISTSHFTTRKGSFAQYSQALTKSVVFFFFKVKTSLFVFHNQSESMSMSMSMLPVPVKFFAEVVIVSSGRVKNSPKFDGVENRLFL